MSELVSELRAIYDDLRSLAEKLNKPEIVMPLAALAVVYKIAGRFEGKLWLVRCLEEASMYDLT